MIRRHIIFFGNPLHGDDGFGAAVYALLAARERPVGLRLTEAGAPGPAALALFQDFDEVIIVDALSPAGAPGRISRPSVTSIIEEGTIAGHGQGLGYLLRALMALQEVTPRVEIIGAEVAAVTPFRLELSAPVARAAAQVAELLGSYFEERAHV